MALIPLLWLALLRFKGRACGVEWWWIAGVFFVSWLADTAAHYFNPWVGSEVYPMLQAAIIALVFLSRRDALKLILVVGAAGLLDLALFGISSWDILLRTVAWGAVIGIVYPLTQIVRLRLTLLMLFLGGLLAWYAYAIWPGWWSWSIYQASRFMAITFFCWAAYHPEPHLKILRRA